MCPTGQSTTILRCVHPKNGLKFALELICTCPGMACSSRTETGGWGFRYKYEQGVDSYYSEHGDDYCNPHARDIAQCVQYSAKMLGLDTATEHPKRNINILDLSCGSGEVTKALQELIGNSVNIIGSDPYTADLYKTCTNCCAYEWSFDDIINCCMEGLEFDVIICSYAVHLCPKEKLKLLSWELARKSKYLCVISPHKKASLEGLGFHEVRGNKFGKSRLTIYKSDLY